MSTRLVRAIRATASVFLAFALVWPACSAAQNDAAEPSLKQVFDKNAADGEDVTQPESTGQSPPTPVVELGRESPRSSIVGFQSAARDGDYERAAEYLDFRGLTGSGKSLDPTEYARRLKIVLDRALWIDITLLSDDPKGHADDDLPSNRDYVGSIKLGDRKIDILLQRVRSDSGTFAWKFSSATVRHILELHAAYGYGPVGERLTRILPDYQIFGLQLWQWAMLLGLLVVSYFVAFVPTWIIGRLVRRSSLALAPPLVTFVTRPARLVAAVILTRSWIDVIHPSVTARAIMRGQTLLIIAVTWATIHFIKLVQEYWRGHLSGTGRAHAIVLLRPAATAAKVIVLFVAVLVWLDNIGFEVTTLLTGLGIGGIAIALAAQKSIENLIGAITLFVASPVRVGEKWTPKLGPPLK